MTTPKSKIVAGGRKNLPVKDSAKLWNANTAYEPEFCQTLIRLMKKGYSIFEVAEHIGVGTRTFYNWSHDFPEFKAAWEDGKDYRRAWLDKGFRDHMTEKFDLKGYQVALTADYGYNDKSTKIEVSVKEDDEVAEKVRLAIDDLHKTTI